jgi:hypothetical protein
MPDGQNLTIANAILKNVYGDINEQINNATPALDGIKSTARNITQVGGLGITFVAHTGRNTGLGARSEDELLGYVEPKELLRHRETNRSGNGTG